MLRDPLTDGAAQLAKCDEKTYNLAYFEVGRNGKEKFHVHVLVTTVHIRVTTVHVVVSKRNYYFYLFQYRD